MKASICTLFEGRFHYGLGALANSLHASGFRGTLWAGYRGELPFWATPLETTATYQQYTVAPECVIRFVRLGTDRHFTNYKPDFMLQLWERYDAEADVLFYIDPDIVVKCEWEFFGEWVRCGIALCEDVNSPVNPTHPLRMRWKSFFEPHGIHLNSALREYVNGGFIGLRKEHQFFLKQWQRIQDIMEPATNGMRGMNLGTRTFIFQKTDQDALNIALYSTEAPVSLIGRESMDFAPGGYTLSHAVGSEKPWAKPFLLRAIGGKPPSAADKAYWRYVEQPIRLFSKPQRTWSRLNLQCAAALGRFMRRS
jgi:hypothetical protein